MAAGQLQAIVHSHPDGPNHPSQPDLEGQIDSEIPWGICPVIGDTEKPLYACDMLWWGDTLPPVPLERRKFIWGIFHCYQLYRDWWRQERGMLPPIWPVGDSFIQDGFNCWDTFRENCGLTDMGKIDISDLQIGDMLLGKVRGSFPNHCAVFVGDDKMLHHPPNGVSGTVELLRWWPYVVTVFRNESTSHLHLYGALAKLYGKKHKVYASTFRDALKIVECNHPGFLRRVNRGKLALPTR
jgi:hypothetical protein